MHVLIHDLQAERFELLFAKWKEKIKIIANTGSIKRCIGCFGCWIKTPGSCVIKDGYEGMGALLASADRVTVISKCTYGGYSPFVKRVLDRSISFLLPFFERKHKETHHKPRYNNRFDLRVCFYGNRISQEEQAAARALVEGNSLNFHTRSQEVAFFDTPEQIAGEVPTL